MSYGKMIATCRVYCIRVLSYTATHTLTLPDPVGITANGSGDNCELVGTLEDMNTMMVWCFFFLRKIGCQGT